MSKPVIIVKAVHEVARVLGGYRQQIEIERPMAVSEFLDVLIARYGEELKKKVLPRENAVWTAALYVNGRNIVHLDGTRTMLNDGDEFLIMTPLSGG